jgi:hypothetical protein
VLREALQAPGYVDPVTIEITAFYHHITQIDADAQHDVAIVWLTVVRPGHTLLKEGGVRC